MNKTNMKRILKTLALSAAAALSLVSCRLDDYDGTALLYPNAIVTVKTADDGTCYLQLTDDTALKPVNIKASPYKKEMRALVNITEEGDCPDARFDKQVKVNSIDSVRTKDVVPTLGEPEDAEVYGDVPIEVVGYWVTGLEDGYLTLSFCAYWGDPSKKHSIDLVAGTDPEDPGLYVLRHNAREDGASANSYRMTGIIAFNLRDASGEWPRTLTLRYKAFNGAMRTLLFSADRYGAELPETERLSAVRALPVE